MQALHIYLHYWHLKRNCRHADLSTLTLGHLQHRGAHARAAQHQPRPLDEQLFGQHVLASGDGQHQVACIVRKLA